MEKKGYRKKEAREEAFYRLSGSLYYDLTMIMKQTVIFAPWEALVPL